MLYDFYKILEITRTASQDEIKRAYRAKAKLVHPDVNSSPKATEVFGIVNEAYEVLTDETKRYLYDIKLNFIDSERTIAERKKQYYGSSVKNDSYTNTITNFQYDWNSFNKALSKEKTDIDYYKRSPFIYNLFFASGMFVGFMIIIVTVVATFRGFWPLPFILITIPGFILVREGWKGIMGKKTMISRLFKRFKK